ncbi:MAG: choice-of-anchor X domain-containing protein [Myxococcota bacterium]
MGKVFVSRWALLSSLSAIGLACSSPSNVTEADDYGLKSSALLPESLPDFAQGFEAVPSVVRDDGVSSFRIRFDVNRAVSAVRLTNPFIFAAGTDLNLYDDGSHGDAVAGDRIFTSSLLQLAPGLATGHFASDPRAPQGLVFVELTTEIVETTGEATGFLVSPSIGVLGTGVPLREVTALGSSLQATQHFFNVRSDATGVQVPLRGWGGDLSAVTRAFYSKFGDDYDFVMLWSNDKLEAINTFAGENFVAGRYVNVKHDYTGNALSSFDNTASYGSAGRLLGVSLIDMGHRGMYAGNMAHEFTHQWSAFTLGTLGLQADSAHWDSRTSVGSIVGGFQWLDNGNGTYTVNADIGRNAVYEMAPLDRYFAGFIAASEVPPVRVALPGTPLQDGYVVQPNEIERTVTVNDIIGVHGPRTPGPATARKDFRVAVGTVSNARLFTAEEMTFYDVLAEAAFRPLEPGEPLPYLDFGFPTLSGYFGPGTSLGGELVPPACPACDSSLFGFEQSGDWQSPAALSLNTTTFSQGVASLAIAASGWTPITSRAFATSEISQLTNILVVDLFIPTAQPNPYWVGDLQLSIRCPSVGLYQTGLGSHTLTNKPRGEFSSLQFTLPAQVTTALSSSAQDCSFQFTLNVNSGSGTWLLDNLRFVP